MNNHRYTAIVLALAVCGLSAITGCHRRPAAKDTGSTEAVTPNPTSAEPPDLTDEQRKVHPNEAGQVPIFAYYDFKAAPDRRTSVNRTPAQFRKDLERLYKENFRPIGMNDFLDNHIDIPLGMKPVILTFDDSLPAQFAYKDDGSIDPDCAVGILKAFHDSHPDFALKGVFYVLPTRTFGVEDDAGKKLQALLDMGFEIGNHTATRHSLRRLSDEQIKKELATAVTRITELAPKAHIDTLAPPMGFLAHNQAVEKDGVYDGQRYHNRAVVTLGARPTSVPYAKSFNPLKVPRILTVEGPAGITNWLDELQQRRTAFVSDGDPNITTVPKNLAPLIVKAKLNGVALRTY